MFSNTGSLQTLSIVAAALLLCATQANAAGASEASQAQARYRQDMALCASGQSNQDLVTCRTEARKAFAEARRGGLTAAPDTTYAMNARQRCAAHTGVDKDACDARMRGEGGMAGSVRAGGILRESVTVVPAP